MKDESPSNSYLSSRFLTPFLYFSDNLPSSLVFERKLWERRKQPAPRSLRSVEFPNRVGVQIFLEVAMKRFCTTLTVVASMFLAGCASHADKSAGGSDRSARVTASGYTKEGCLLNLKLTAREKSVRLIPDDVQVEASWLMLIFPFLNQEAYRCSGSVIERVKRPTSKDPLYPIE